MRQYCRAYHLADLRRFPGWSDAAGENNSTLADDTVVYVWDDLTVVVNPVVPADGVLWHAVTEEWERFCLNELDFAVPDELTETVRTNGTEK